MILPAYCPPRLLAAVGISLFFHAGFLFYFPFFQSVEIVPPEEQITRVWLMSDVAADPVSNEATKVPPVVNMPSMTEPPAAPLLPPLKDVLQDAEIHESSKVSQAEEGSLSVEPNQQKEFSELVEKEETVDLSLLNEAPELLNGVPTIPLESLTPRGRLAVPPYPDQAKRLGYEGRVVLELVISKAGRVIDARVLESDASELLINSCIKTVLRRWRFTSLDKEVITRKTFRFRLNG